MSEPLRISPSLVLPADELRWSAVRSSGPGGQNVNKVASKVELRFDVAHSHVLDEPTKARLRVLAGRRMDRTGVLVLSCQETRDQRRNLELARQRLAALVRRALCRPKPRRATRPTRGSTARRLADKERRAAKKRSRGERAEQD
jgi:ribosome-associated protein